MIVDEDEEDTEGDRVATPGDVREVDVLAPQAVVVDQFRLQ